MNADLRGLKVLLLQGPNGPFFARLCDELVQAGAEVQKVHLNAADSVYYGRRKAIPYRDTLEQFPAFLDLLLREHGFDICFYFGDQRPYHRSARPVLEQHAVPYFVFEDGYLRPDYVTVEEGGVNYRSPLKRLGKSAQQIVAEIGDNPLPELPELVKAENSFAWSVWHTIINSLFVTSGRLGYLGYHHHRDVNTIRQALLWARSGLRRVYFSIKERGIARKLFGELPGRFFIAGLQVFNDSQVQLSRFNDVRDFIHEVIESFARHAPPDAHLVLKHHPADRAYREYGGLIAELGRRHRISDRIYYVHDLHLPTLLDGALGTVVINSTVGWSSLHHGKPVYGLCESTYGYLGLAATGTLAEFWNNPPAVDRKVVLQIERWLRATSQANGSVWVKLAGAGPTGLRWPPAFLARIENIASHKSR